MRKNLIIGAWQRWKEDPSAINKLERILQNEPNNLNANILRGRHYVGLVNKALDDTLSSLDQTTEGEEKSGEEDQAALVITKEALSYAREALSNYRIAEISLNSVARPTDDAGLQKAIDTSDEILSTLSYLYRLVGKDKNALQFMEKLYAGCRRNAETLNLIVDTVARDFKERVEVSDSSTYWISKYHEVNIKCAEYFEQENIRAAMVYIESSLNILEKSKMSFEERATEAKKETDEYKKTNARYDVQIKKAAEMYRRIIFNFTDEVVLYLIREEDNKERKEWEKGSKDDRTTEIKLRKTSIPELLVDKLERVKTYSSDDHEATLRILNIRYMRGDYETVQKMASSALEDSTMPEQIAAKVEFINLMSYFADDKQDKAVSCAEQFKSYENLSAPEKIFVKGIKALGHLLLNKKGKARWELMGTPWLKKSYQPELREYRRLRNMIYRRGK
jgi:hypothetical protein